MEERHEYTEPRPNNNSEAIQETKASVEGLTCFSNEQMHSIPDNQELGTTPEYTSKTGGPDDEKSGIQQNMEEETKELRSEDVLSESSEKNNQTIFKLAENDQVEVANLLSSDKDIENLALPIEFETTTLNECSELQPEDANKNSIELMNPPIEDSTQTISKLAENDQVEAANLLSSDKDIDNLVLPIEFETTTLNKCSELQPEGANKNSIELMNPPIEGLTQTTSKLAENDQVEAANLLSSDKGTENLVLPNELETTTLNESSKLPPEEANENSIELMNPPIEDLTQNNSIEKLETVPITSVSNSQQLVHKDKKILKSKKKNYKLRSLVTSDRVLRSRTQEKAKAPEPSNELNNSTAGEGKRKKKRNIKGKGGSGDGFSSIRNRLRYLVNRIKYEQSLIDAYSSEGWKGFSSDKLKPEKELQRASSEIMRRKLKIRDLFQHLDSLCAEGRLSESLFDSEGQIDSEDIFCAKCGSKELSLENDIILCDGICDRGFHQFCLEPPLLNTDIPPDDEGWLCPGCDCKDDCLDLLNEFQGSNLSITDGWEKVYPEAAAAAAGRNSDHALGLPSDDSEDGDYDPDAPDTINQEDESSSDESSSDQSSSDESGYASASEELEAAPNDDQYLGLPADDSEDDDYEPGAPELDEGVNQESSNSDFTSDSEDLAAFDDSTMPVRNSNGQSSGCGPSKSVLHNELQNLLESGPDKDGLEPVSGRRQVERLDYKKLHDETYGNVPTDSSDDTYGSISIDSSDDRGRGSRTRKRSPKNPVPALSENGTNDDLNNTKTKRSSKRRTRQKPGAENMNNSVTRTPEDSVKSSSCVRRTASSSSHRRLGQQALERLFASFQENQYPERATKENLAQELGLSPKQVSKWFENTRWSTRHPSSTEASKAKSASRMRIQSSETSGKLPKPGQESGACFRDTDKNGAQHQESPNADSAVAPCQSGDTRDDTLATQKTTRPESTATKSRKRKGRSDHVASRSKDRKESQKPPAKSPKVNEIQTADKIRTRRRRSI